MSIQKTYKINVGADAIEIDFLGSNRHFDWLEFSLVCNKSNQHATISIATIMRSLPKR